MWTLTTSVLLLFLFLITQLDAKRSLQQFICLQDAKLCPDGSYVSRDFNNNCEFPECPTSISVEQIPPMLPPSPIPIKPILPIIPDLPILITSCCDPLTRPDGTNGNPICFEGSACCPDGTWSCSIGDGKTFSCGYQLLNSATHPEAFGEICTSTCPIGQCIHPSGACDVSVLCFANPCQVNTCATATTCEANYCGGCHAIFKDDNGNIIDSANCDRNAVACGIDHCVSYNDGCNVCSCTDRGFPVCTERACGPSQQTEAYCTGCEPGYILNPTTNKCEGCVCTMIFDPVCCDGNQYGNSCEAACQQATNCSPGVCTVAANPSICGGFANCVNYNDGCNHCMCGDHGVVACTQRYCFKKGRPRCTLCEAGYTLSGNICIN